MRNGTAIDDFANDALFPHVFFVCESVLSLSALGFFSVSLYSVWECVAVSWRRRSIFFLYRSILRPLEGFIYLHTLNISSLSDDYSNIYLGLLFIAGRTCCRRPCVCLFVCGLRTLNNWTMHSFSICQMCEVRKLIEFLRSANDSNSVNSTNMLEAMRSKKLG